jgi:hypothetical protein
MKLLWACTATIIAASILMPATAQNANRQPGALRCGWYDNPTPGNHYLTDRDGQWTLALQGARGAPGMDNMPDMTTGEWVRTNGYYGYGCACMRVTVNADTERVTRLYSARSIPLSRCRNDRALERR